MELTTEEMKRIESVTGKEYTRINAFVDSTPQTEEQRTKVVDEVIKAIKAIENGDFMEIKNLDGPKWFPMPQCHIDDMVNKTFKYRQFQVLNMLHKQANKFDRWFMWKQHKFKRMIQGK